MKQKYLFLLLFFIMLLSTVRVKAQYNYVANPSFEEYDSIFYYYPDSTYYKYYVPKNWFNPTTIDFKWYRNSNLNNVETGGGLGISPYGVPQSPWDYCWPVDGDAYGFMNIYNPMGANYDGLRMYLENRLDSPLVQGKYYCLSFYVTLLDSAQLSIDQIGIYFSLDTMQNIAMVYDSCYLLVTPHIVSPAGEFFDIRNKWYCIRGTYLAHGGEQFMTIGNFQENGATNYIWVPGASTCFGPDAAYEVDMVSLIECDSYITTAYAGIDTTICLGDSILLGVVDTTDGYSFEWLPAEGLNDSCNSNPLASPSQTTTYILQQWYYNSFLRTDTVTVSVLDCSTPPPDTGTVRDNLVFIPNIFSPNGDGQNDYFVIHGENISTFNLKIYNRWGICVFGTSTANVGWDGLYKGKDCPEGVYLYVAEISFVNGDSMVKNGNVTLIK